MTRRERGVGEGSDPGGGNSGGVSGGSNLKGEGTAAKEAFCDGRKICEGIRSLRFKRAGS